MTQFRIPAAYRQTVESGQAGFEPYSALAPWYFLRPEDFKEFSGDGGAPLIGFARRQDNDDWACFDLEGDDDAVTMVEWTRQMQAGDRFPTFEAWMNSVREDIEEWRDIAAEFQKKN